MNRTKDPTRPMEGSKILVDVYYDCKSRSGFHARFHLWLRVGEICERDGIYVPQVFSDKRISLDFLRDSYVDTAPRFSVHPSYCKNSSGVVSFVEVVHCSVDEYLRRIRQHWHELHHRIVSCFLCCDDKDAMTVMTQKKIFKNSKRLKS